MKSEKGITLLSLIVYIALLTLVLGILSVVSNYFYKNVNYITDTGKYVSNYNKFNMYFIEDVKNNSEIYSISEDGTQLVFADGTNYTFADNSIYRNKVRICENIYALSFSKRAQTDENDFTKQIITVNFAVRGSKLFETENDYVLKYW